jgi:hypothetical protein
MDKNKMIAYPLTGKMLFTLTGLLEDPLLKKSLANCSIDDNYIYIPVSSISDNTLIDLLSSRGKLLKVS